MSSFTKEQLAELEAVYGLKRLGKYKVRDGYVNEGDSVWWRGVNGPEQFVVDINGMHHPNMIRYPEAYCIKKPEVSPVTYKD